MNTGYEPAQNASFVGQWETGATITGCSGKTASDKALGNQSTCIEGYAWNESNNKASTTGNMTGIYDMNGGNWEYVMAFLKDAEGFPVSGTSNNKNSGFNGIYGCPTCDGQTSLSKTDGIDFPTDSRYYDLYDANSTELGDNTWYQYGNGPLGDTFREIAVSKENASSGYAGLWFSDRAQFPVFKNPFDKRGGHYGGGTGTGLFCHTIATGTAATFNSFRLVLAP